VPAERRHADQAITKAGTIRRCARRHPGALPFQTSTPALQLGLVASFLGEARLCARWRTTAIMADAEGQTVAGSRVGLGDCIIR
jgi:hypothetical protein